MNFQKIPPVTNGKSLLDSAFGRARKSGITEDFSGNWLQVIRKKETFKYKSIQDYLTQRLDAVLKNFPQVEELSPFYQKLMELTIEIQSFKKCLGAMGWAKQKINFFQKEYSNKVNYEKDRHKIQLISTQYYGRISSVIKQIEPSLKYLEEARRMMRTYPDIKNMFTVCIYGFPNVGKSTLLNELCGTKAQVAAYAFTTKSINSGFMERNGKKVQILDVPGTLDRHEKSNLIELQAELVVKEVANVIVYVFDLSEHCGYSIKEQEKLLDTVGKRKPVLIYLSKLDLVDKEVLAGWKRKSYSFSELKEAIFGLSEK